MDFIYALKKEMLRRNYSIRTMQAYIFCLKRFLRFYKGEDIRKVSKKDVKDYLDYLVGRNASGSTLNIHLNALKFFTENILNKKFMVKIRYSKTPKTLPIVLTKEEVVKLVNSIKNKKHKLMIKLMYGAGLRVSELVNLRVKDLELSNNFGWVRKGKGDKDRLFIIPELLKAELINFVNENRLSFDNYLFNSYNGHMSARSVQEIVKRATKLARIDKRVHPHTLRHSYATHLIENGYDVASVQSLLGHNSMETTMVYLHIAKPNMINVKSPLDSLDLGSDSQASEYEKSGYEIKKNKGIPLIS